MILTSGYRPRSISHYQVDKSTYRPQSHAIIVYYQEIKNIVFHAEDSFKNMNLTFYIVRVKRVPEIPVRVGSSSVPEGSGQLL